ncbi:MAG TPA: hypothetical protein VFK48_12040 [Usitatibacter sp.]|nr:hypothetical protein [Usitatibacter sp.]
MEPYERWQPLLNRTSTEEEVLRVLREYVQTLLPSDLALLPPGLRLLFETPQEVESSAVALTQQDVRTPSDEPSSRLLNELAHTFACAQSRLREMRLRQIAEATSKRAAKQR